MRRRTIALVSGGALLAICLVLTWWSISSWFVWSLLPDRADVKLLLHPDTDAAPALSAAVRTFPEHELVQTLLPHSTTMALATFPAGETMVMVPHLGSWGVIKGQLQAQGWRVETFGLTLRASRLQDPSQLPRLTHAAATSLHLLTNRAYPASPWLVGQAQTSIPSLIEPPVSFMATKDNGSLDIWGDTHTQLAPRPSNVLTQEAVAPIADLFIDMPSKPFTVVAPVELQAAWNQNLAQKLGFTHTQPDFLKTLEAYPEMILATQGNTTAIGIQGDVPGFVAQAKTWLQEEERRTRTRSRAFRLPDGTLGYEKVPGDAQAVVTPAPTLPTCLVPIPGKTTLSICWSGERAFLTTTPEFSQRLMASSNGLWRVQASPAWLGPWHLPFISHLAAIGSTNFFYAHLTLTPTSDSRTVQP